MTPLDFPELPATTVMLEPLSADLQRAAVYHQGAERARIFLLPGGVFTPGPLIPRALPADDVVLALVQLIARHGVQAAGRAAYVRALGAGRAPIPVRTLPGWPDLPQAACRHGRVSARLDVYEVQVGSATASLHLTRDSGMPVGWTAGATSPRELLLALGRLMYCHYQVLGGNAA